MDDDATKKGIRNKEDQTSLDITLDMSITTNTTPPLPSRDLNLPRSSADQPPPPPPPHASALSTSSSADDDQPELIQDAKRLKLTRKDSSSSPAPSNQLSCSPRSGRPPLPPPRVKQLTIGPPTTPTSGPIDPAQQAKSDLNFNLNPAQLRMHVQHERARASFKLARQKARRGSVDLMGPLMLTRIRPGLSPLGPGHLAPHDLVKHVLSAVKEFLNRFSAMKDISKNSQPPNSTPVTPDPPPAQLLSPHAIASTASLSSDQIHSIAAPAPSVLSTLASADPTVEQVIHMLDEYVDTISKTASAQEMEDRLQEFQVRVKVDPLPSWYALMRKSSLDFFDNLSEYFVCEALESDPEDDDNNDDGEQAENGPNGSESSSL